MDPQLKNTSEMFYSLVNAAKANVHTRLTLIKSLSEYFVYLKTLRATKQFIRSLKKLKKKFFKEYLRQRKKDIDIPALLVSYRTMDLCIRFYSIERDNLKNYLEEYEEYICSGHFGTILRNEPRAPQDMHSFSSKIQDEVLEEPFDDLLTGLNAK